MWRQLVPRRRHIIFIGIALPIFILVLIFVTRNSDSYEAAEAFVSSDGRIRQMLGPVTRVNFRFWDGFHAVESANGGNANYSFAVVGEQKQSVVKVRLVGRRGQWNVVAASIRFPDGAIQPIVGKIEDAETSESERGEL